MEMYQIPDAPNYRVSSSGRIYRVREVPLKVTPEGNVSIRVNGRNRRVNPGKVLARAILAMQSEADSHSSVSVSELEHLRADNAELRQRLKLAGIVL